MFSQGTPARKGQTGAQPTEVGIRLGQKLGASPSFPSKRQLLLPTSVSQVTCLEYCPANSPQTLLSCADTAPEHKHRGTTPASEPSGDIPGHLHEKPPKLKELGLSPKRSPGRSYLHLPVWEAA